MTWNQKHITAKWEEIKDYVSGAKHKLTDRYIRRGITNRTTRVTNARRQRINILMRGPLWMTKRYSRWYGTRNI
jgi:hypothetical protein